MRLRGKLTQHGCKLLWQKFLPTLEKFGKTCQVLIGVDEVHLIQTALNTDGVHVTARFSTEALFEPDNYKCTSKHFNLIGFQVEVGLLLRVLKGAAANNAESVDLKLTQRRAPGAEDGAPTKPFLSFTATGAGTVVVQDVPIGRTYSAAEVSDLVAVKDVGAYCSAYVDLVPALAAALAIVDRLKAVDDTGMLAIGRSGDAHVLVQTPSVSLGAALRNLSVYPQDVFEAATTIDRTKPCSDQLEEALASGAAVSVHVQLKQLARVLHATALTEPFQVLCGIAEGGGHVHVLHVFKDPHKEDVYDDTMTLAFKLPVRDG